VKAEQLSSTEQSTDSSRMQPAETANLVKRAQDGDQAAFAKLVQPHMRKAYHTALKITRNREDAEDAAQQTFLKAFANIGQFQGSAQFSTWLTRIAMNEALMLVRKRRSENSHLTYETDSEEGTHSIEHLCGGDHLEPEVLFAKKENQRIVREAVDSLRGTLRVVVWLLGLEERQSKDAAKILNLSQSAVKTRFLRARQELRECLADRV
jgi:RNA polymerase sigma-70 factor, ECF subfamily